jgi:DNA-binding GntR family transcriptional regulator
LSSVDVAYEALREAIAKGEHPAGTRLVEEDVAATLGLSRTPVREALRRLHADGLVSLEPRRGALVAEWSADDLDELFELRALVEGYSARRAATRVSDEQVGRLVGLCEQMESEVAAPSPDFEVIGRLNGEFHALVHKAASGRFVSGLLTTLIQMPLVMRTFYRYSSEELARSVGHHREVTAALAARRPEWAEAVMHAHVEAARVTLRRDLPR